MSERRGEFERIHELLAGLPAGERVVVGPGDDAAVLRPRDGFDLVVTTDTFVEGRHFRRDLLDAAGVGRRLAAANLSDLAAMAAQPRWAVISCAAPRALAAAWVRDVEWACAASLAADGAAVVGGNLSSSDGPCSWSVTLIGEVERGRHWTRSGGRPGDRLAVTGAPGRAAAALALATAGDAPSPALVPADLWESFASPVSRVRAALALSRAGGVRAAIDISDGLFGDLTHLARASGAGARVREGALGAPGGGEVQRLGPSDDYELLLAIEPARYDDCARAATAAGSPLTPIGELTDDGVLLLERTDGSRVPLRGAGWDHFG
jgi:thiamine-monophosphate kinase